MPLSSSSAGQTVLQLEQGDLSQDEPCPRTVPTHFQGPPLPRASSPQPHCSEGASTFWISSGLRLETLRIC